MHDHIREYVNGLFANIPSSRMVDEAREELLSGCLDKYEDLIKEGSSPEDAYRIVISGIGDVDELIGSLGKATEFDAQKIAANRSKRAIFISIAVALYIIAVATIPLFESFYIMRDFSVVPFLTIAAIATGILIYGNISTSSPYKKQEDTIVEEVKVKIAGNDTNTKLRKALSSTMWTLIVFVYLIISFWSGWWHVTWIIFLIGALAETIITSVMSGKTGSLYGTMWLIIVIVYFVFSFSTWQWAWSWLIFPLGAAIQQIIRLLKIWRELE